MGKPQIKTVYEENDGNDRKPRFSSEEPARPIEHVHGEVAAMQMLIASRFSQELPDGEMDGLADNMERLVSSVSRLSGYVLLALAVAGLALLLI